MPTKSDSVSLVAESYFQTFVFFRDVPDSATINGALRDSIYAWRDADPAGIVRSNTARIGSWHSGLDMADRPEFDVLTAKVRAHAVGLFNSLGYNPGYVPWLTEMWANIHPRHGYNRNHLHSNTLWSGVSYVQAPPGSGRLVFTDPRAQALNFRPSYRPDRPTPPHAWTEVFFEAIEGRIIFFPAWLRHEVEPNVSDHEGRDGDRISVSFNFSQAQTNAAREREREA